MDFSKLIEWVKLKPRYFFTVAFATSVVLFAPIEVIERLGLAEFIADYRGWVGLVFLVSFAAWLSHGIAYIGAAVLSRLQGWRWVRTGRKYLLSLSPPEREILRSFIHGNTKTITLDIASGIHAGLESNQVIYRPTSVSQYTTHFDFNIQPWAWDYLRKSPELLAG